MRRTLMMSLAVTLTAAWLVAPARGQMATLEEARNVAQNWVTFTIHLEGGWGGFENAQVLEVQPFMRGDRQLGYFGHVDPVGFIVVSLRKELAPVKAYSTRSYLDPTSDMDLTDYIKVGMERVLDAIEAQLGPIEEIATEDLITILEAEFRATWQVLELDPEVFYGNLKLGGVDTDYEMGQEMLASHWHQGPPYNDDCPWDNCNNLNGRTSVGCVATAGAQIMRYWDWPPYGVGAGYNDRYDWPNMLNMYIWNGLQQRFEDENGDPVTQAQINAVAELCWEVGVAVGMDYGCPPVGSWAYTADMEDVFEDHYRYSVICNRQNRPDYTAVGWFNRIRAQCDANRPVQYRIPGHSVVADGWRITYPGGQALREYHIIYGWGLRGTCNGCDTWYALDHIYGGGPGEEFMLENIVPAAALGHLLSGEYLWNPLFPYRYFDRDTLGLNATFAAGQRLQFLPNVSVGALPAAYVEFQGFPGLPTILFTCGDESRGVRIDRGSIKIYYGGTLALRREE